MKHIARTRKRNLSEILAAGGFMLVMIFLASCATLGSIRPNADVIEDTETPESTETATSESTPTNTPLPTATPEPSATPSPTVFWDGPIVIGESVAGRPIEAYRFGTGSRKLLIIGGIHGGYEWNTIKLTEQLIALILGRPDWIPDDVTLFIIRSLNPDGEARALSLIHI